MGNSIVKANTSETLEALGDIETLHGVVRPETVVEVARDPNHVLHKHFDWDNTSAGDKYRLQQARALITSYKITVTYDHPGGGVRKVTIPAMVQPVKEAGYVSVEVAMTDTDQRAQVVAMYKTRFRNLSDRVTAFDEFENVRLAIDEL